MTIFSSIYDNLQDYSFTDYDKFCELINNSYQNLTSRDYVINNDSCPCYTLTCLTKDDLHDRFAVDLNGIKFDCLITPYEPYSSKSLFVIFSGARTLDTDVIPIFRRWSYYRFIDSIVLNIADPMFAQFQNLTLGWYYGTKTVSYIELLSKIILQVCSLLKINTQNLYLFGSSGGGYVALQLSMYINNATHIVINPQIQLDKYFYSTEFSNQTGNDLLSYDPFRRNETINIICENNLSSKSKFLILQNLQAKLDCVNHLFPLCKVAGINTLQFGLNCSNNITIWLYSCMGGHVTQGDQFIFSYILYLANKISSGDPISHLDHLLIKNINVLWRQMEWFKFRISQLSKNSK